MTVWTDGQLQDAREIVAIVVKYGTIPPLLALGVVIQEASLDPQIAGDAGQSYGNFQLYQPAHPGSAFVARNPWYDYGYPEVRDRWELTYANLGGHLAWADPAGRPAFLADFAPAAQGSDPWDLALGQARYQQGVEVLELIS